MDDPTGGMWIYFIFLIIPLARIIPRIIRKLKGQVPKAEGDFDKKPMWQPEPFRQEQKSFFEEKNTKKEDGWLNKEDFEHKK